MWTFEQEQKLANIAVNVRTSIPLGASAARVIPRKPAWALQVRMTAIRLEDGSLRHPQHNLVLSAGSRLHKEKHRRTMQEL